jgi:hypothetical protein
MYIKKYFLLLILTLIFDFTFGQNSNYKKDVIETSKLLVNIEKIKPHILSKDFENTYLVAIEVATKYFGWDEVYLDQLDPPLYFGQKKHIFFHGISNWIRLNEFTSSGEQAKYSFITISEYADRPMPNFIGTVFFKKDENGRWKIAKTKISKLKN